MAKPDTIRIAMADALLDEIQSCWGVRVDRGVDVILEWSLHTGFA